MKLSAACRRLVLFVMALSPSLAAEAGGLALVEDGASDYVIVRPAESSPSQVYAAGELQAFIGRMTGATLPITTDADPLPDRAILLGRTRYTDDALGRKIEMPDLGDDGFTLLTGRGHLLIIGGKVRGTLYGVYELMEKYGGCRWYASFFSVVPERRTWRIPELNETQRPAFAMREPFWRDMFDGDFAARCKVNGNSMRLDEKHGGKIRFGAGLFVHTFYRLMPPGEFFKNHPEYFSQINGKRSATHSQLCLTNPDVVRIMTERVLAKIRSDPTAKIFSVSQNDCGGFCTCPECRAMDEREGSHAGTMIHFVNQIAEAVEKEFPDVWIETLAYQYTRTPPKHVKPRRNVVPRLCSIECDFSQPLDESPYPQNVKFVKDLAGWSAVTDKLYIWDYTTNFRHYIGPHPNFSCLQGNIRLFRDNGVVGVFEQGAYQAPHAEFAELRAWILAKLLWNPEQDVEALYDDFFRGYYGPAAKPVRRYFDELQALAKPDDCVVTCYAPMDAKWYTDEFFERAAKLWAEAERLTADHPKFRSNVRIGAVPVLYARLVRLGHGKAPHEPGAAAPRVQSMASDLLERIQEGKITATSENIQNHRRFMESLRKMAGEDKPDGLKAEG